MRVAILNAQMKIITTAVANAFLNESDAQLTARSAPVRKVKSDGVRVRIGVSRCRRVPSGSSSRHGVSMRKILEQAAGRTTNDKSRAAKTC